MIPSPGCHPSREKCSITGKPIIQSSLLESSQNKLLNQIFGSIESGRPIICSMGSLPS